LVGCPWEALPCCLHLLFVNSFETLLIRKGSLQKSLAVPHYQLRRRHTNRVLAYMLDYFSVRVPLYDEVRKLNWTFNSQRCCIDVPDPQVKIVYYLYFYLSFTRFPCYPQLKRRVAYSYYLQARCTRSRNFSWLRTSSKLPKDSAC